MVFIPPLKRVGFSPPPNPHEDDKRKHVADDPIRNNHGPIDDIFIHCELKFEYASNLIGYAMRHSISVSDLLCTMGWKCSDCLALKICNDHLELPEGCSRNYRKKEMNGISNCVVCRLEGSSCRFKIHKEFEEKESVHSI